jgi:hypothetical protein
MGDEAGHFDINFLSCIDFTAKRPASFSRLFTKRTMSSQNCRMAGDEPILTCRENSPKIISFVLTGFDTDTSEEFTEDNPGITAR